MELSRRGGGGGGRQPGPEGSNLGVGGIVVLRGRESAVRKEDEGEEELRGIGV